MLFSLRVKIAFIFSLTFFSFHSVAAMPQPELYMGFLHLEGADYKIPVTLDLIKRGRIDSPKADLSAYLKLNFGGFDSHEYVTQYYYVRDFDWQNFNLVLDSNVPGNGPDISVYDMTPSSDRSRLVGKFRSFRSQTLDGGEIELVQVRSLEDFEKVKGLLPNYEIQPMLAGLYEMSARNVDLISIETIRSGSWNPSATNPFSGYILNVRYLKRNSGDTAFPIVTTNLFQNYTYNFYKASISLNFPILGSLDCKLTTQGLDCGNRFTARRVTRQKLYSQILRPTEIPKRLKPHQQFTERLSKFTESANDREIDGRYYGYFYVPYFDRIKRVSFDFINTSGGGAKLHSVITRVHYGTKESDGLMPYKFQPVQSPGDCDSLVLEGEGGEISLLLKNWSKEKVEGYWFSKSYGFVGEFVAAKGDAFPNISEENAKKLIVSIDGTYSWEHAKEGEKPVTDTIKIATARLHEGQVNAYFPVALRAIIATRLNLEPPFDRAGFETSNQFILDPFTGLVMLRTATRTYLGGWGVDRLELTSMSDGRGMLSNPMQLRIFKRE